MKSCRNEHLSLSVSGITDPNIINNYFVDFVLILPIHSEYINQFYNDAFSEFKFEYQLVDAGTIKDLIFIKNVIPLILNISDDMLQIACS